MATRIFINTPTNGKKEDVAARISELSKRIMGRGDIPVSPLEVSVGVKSLGDHIGDDVAAVIDDCDGIVLDMGWKNNEVCMVIYHAAIVFKKTVYHTKEEYDNVRSKYVI